MTPDEIEEREATALLMQAFAHGLRNGRQGDATAIALAVLVRAVELASPELSQKNRASLFLGEE